MARKSSPTILQEELYPPAGEPQREAFDDTRLLDLDVEQESPFLRGQKRVSARRAPVAKRVLRGLAWAVIAALVLGAAGLAGASVYRYTKQSWRFRINSSDEIEIAGTQNVTHAQIMEVMGGDIGRNIFFIPLAERQAQLEKIPWVETASVMRFVPHRLRLEIHERVPVAFARVGSRILLTDATGTLMELPAKQKYSFPVVLGINPGEPPSTRVERMKIYNQLMRELNSDGGHYCEDLSEVDLSDPDDVKIVTNDPAGAVLVHLGASAFLLRYKTYIAHVQAWRQQFDKLESVNLRYDHQIIVNPDREGVARLPQLSPAAAHAAMAAGVKPAALVHLIPVRPAVTPENKPPAPVEAKPAPKPAARRHETSKPTKSAKHRPASKPSFAAASKSAGGASGALAPPPASANTPAAVRHLSASNGIKKPSPAIAGTQDHKDQDHP
jgi:cell division protein FtsQ